ncbi:hypothetical protein N7523_002271 [Penicillium sp. IBT 18751x]|nr:hypothetical protein N7523_002271 [Penicillium sp. IBT 18751x]
MAPSHLLRASLPIRSMASSMALTRAVLPSTLSITHTIRNASTSSEPAQPPAASPHVSGPQPLKRPAMLRNYASSLKTGTVVSVGRMQRTVTVSFRHNIWDKRIRKYYPQETRYLVSDPRDSLREGDVIEFSSGAPKSRHVHHVVERILTPFAIPIDERPAVMSPQERQAEREKRWAAKYVRRESRRLGEEVDLASRLELSPGEELSQAEMIHRIHQGNERVGKIKALVEKRLAMQAQSDS